jgi:hypothetical protein
MFRRVFVFKRSQQVKSGSTDSPLVVFGAHKNDVINLEADAAMGALIQGIIAFSLYPLHLNCFESDHGRRLTLAQVDQTLRLNFSVSPEPVGRDRAEALARMNRALEMFVVEGIQT